MQLCFYTKEKSPVAEASVTVRIMKYLPFFLQSLPLLLVNMSLYACLSSGDEHGMPQCEGTECHCNRAAKNPEVYDALVKHSLPEGEGRRWYLAECLIACKLEPLRLMVLHFLDSCIGFPKHDATTDATVDATHGHEEAEGEEVAMVVVPHTVIKPGTMVIHF